MTYLDTNTAAILALFYANLAILIGVVQIWQGWALNGMFSASILLWLNTRGE
jgi:hypothetical protein